MTNGEPDTIRVFISYSHDSQPHIDRVLELSQCLREDGIDCWIDQYEESPEQGWTEWMIDQINQARYVLLVCTETYNRRYHMKENEESGRGMGVTWEGAIIRGKLYNSYSKNRTFVPLVFSEEDFAFIPEVLNDSTAYNPSTDDGYQSLYRKLTGQPKVKPAVLGQRRDMPSVVKVERKQNFGKPWNVPYPRNTFFTGREDVIKQLHDALAGGETAALTQAISGLGGIGKTQTAVEYAYRYRNEYEAVFWVRAETEAEIRTGFVDLARTLGLREAGEQDENLAVSAAQRWLASNNGWLLVLDNADNVDLVKAFYPSDAKGHVLLTSRASVFQSLGTVKPVELTEMPPDEALEFLFKRTMRERSDKAEEQAAADIANELGYLPLALEQAGAYITQIKCKFSEYLVSYKKNHLKLLERSGPVTGDQNRSVATTWTMNFRAVRRASRASADLLRICAFLSPDKIPVELLILGAAELGPALSKALEDAADDPLVVNEVLEPLSRYSLIRHDTDSDTFSVHRLVQEVIQANLNADGRRAWAERTVNALSASFPMRSSAVGHCATGLFAMPRPLLNS